MVKFYVEYYKEHPVSKYLGENIKVSKPFHSEIIYCESDAGLDKESLKKQFIEAYKKAGFEIKRFIPI